MTAQISLINILVLEWNIKDVENVQILPVKKH